MAKTFIISDESLNTYGFWILTSGIMLEQFVKNPIMYFMHRRPNKYDENVAEKLPIGIWENIRIENGKLLADPKFDLSDPFAKIISDKVNNGFLRMASLGAEPVETSSDPVYLRQGQTRETVTKCLALEASIVDIGGNMNAFALAAESGCAIYKAGNLINLSANNENFIANINQTPDMKQIALALGLPETANEAQILEAITAKNQIIEANKVELQKVQDARVAEIVAKAVVDRKFPDASKEQFIQLLKNNFELGAKIIADLKPQATASETLNLNHKTEVSTVADKKFTELSMAEITELRTNDRPAYIKLYKAEYGKEPVIEIE